uniref:LysR substrate-binding domain-containing protein n=1 Tax=Salmonella enterica TaxID=28901 RepID=UPI00398C2DE4
LRGWDVSDPQWRVAEVHFTRRMIATDMVGLREGAMAGVGLVQLHVLMVKEQLAAGELVAVLEEWEPRREVIHAVFPARRGLLPSVRALVDFLTEEYARMVDE